MSGTVSNRRRAQIACDYRIKSDEIHCNQDISDECKHRIARQREKEKYLVPLVIDKRTTIMVTPDKCNEAYAQAYRERWKDLYNDLKNIR